MFECFWKTSHHSDKKSFQYRDKSWTVLGGARLSVHLNVVESLHSTKAKWFFDAAKRAGPWQGNVGERGTAINLNVFTWLYNIHTNRIFNTVKGTGPCCGGARPSHQFECFWNASYYPDEKVLQHREMSNTVFGGARPSVYLNVVECLHKIKTKWFLNAAKWSGPWQGMLRSAAQP